MEVRPYLPARGRRHRGRGARAGRSRRGSRPGPAPRSRRSARGSRGPPWCEIGSPTRPSEVRGGRSRSWSRGRGLPVILVGGVSAGDPLAPFFAALDGLGGRVLRRGVPAHPGSMIWLAELGDSRLLGLPQCGMFTMATAADLCCPACSPVSRSSGGLGGAGSRRGADPGDAVSVSGLRAGPRGAGGMKSDDPTTRHRRRPVRLRPRGYVADRDSRPRSSSPSPWAARCCWKARPEWARPRWPAPSPQVLGAELIRLQCYEGLDVNTAVYEWDYPRQMLEIRLLEARGEAKSAATRDIFSAGVPDPAAPAPGPGEPGGRAAGAADRRGGPGGRGVRGVPARDAERLRGQHSRDRHHPGGSPAASDPHQQPDARGARRAQAALPLPLDRLSHRRARAGHPAGPAAGGARARSAREIVGFVQRLRAADLTKAPGYRRDPRLGRRAHRAGRATTRAGAGGADARRAAQVSGGLATMRGGGARTIWRSRGLGVR